MHSKQFAVKYIYCFRQSEIKQKRVAQICSSFFILIVKLSEKQDLQVYYIEELRSIFSYKYQIFGMVYMYKVFAM